MEAADKYYKDMLMRKGLISIYLEAQATRRDDAKTTTTITSISHRAGL